MAYGAACSKDTASTQRCKDDSLCIAGPGGSGATFCTTLCRIDADCPTGSACLEYPQPLPNNSNALVGECTPVTLIPGTICTSEGACPAGQGCVLYGARTTVRTCKAGAGTKSLGEACTAPAQCRSGECYDRNFGIGSTANRALCSGVCARNSDCAMNQRCVVEVVGNNGTIDDPLDDVVVGDCRSLFSATIGSGVPEQQRLRDPGQGRRHLRPDLRHLLQGERGHRRPVCRRRCLRPGPDLRARPAFARGACVLQGCATRGRDRRRRLPGRGSTCASGMSDEPLYRCYEGCATAGGCSRQADNYFCAPAQTGQSISICLSR